MKIKKKENTLTVAEVEPDAGTVAERQPQCAPAQLARAGGEVDLLGFGDINGGSGEARDG